MHVPFLFYFIPVPIPFAAPARPDRDVETFQTSFEDAAARPVTEIVPAAAGDGAAALGFALAWCGAQARDETLLIAATDDMQAEYGAPYPPGLSQYGLAATRLLHVRAHTLKEALWACEQALALPRMRALCIVPQKSRLTLTETRRLHLAAERSGARCVLLRFDPLSPSAAWTRWRIAAAASHGADAELGRPCFAATLTRRRSGPSGQSWLLEWNADEHAFTQREQDASAAGSTLAGPVVAASAHRPAEAQRRRAG
ncbi:MAG: hypothetical protein JNM47_04275 [Hyphomonadaceae bacterium]|nr:hypothetical protein [Hyphomonadaceae bacterium]